MATIGSVVGCFEPPSGSTVMPKTLPEANVSPAMVTGSSDIRPALSGPSAPMTHICIDFPAGGRPMSFGLRRMSCSLSEESTVTEPPSGMSAVLVFRSLASMRRAESSSCC